MRLTLIKIKVYLSHFLPLEIVGPVAVIFSLEGVIDGLFTQFVPMQYETFGWFVLFLVSIFFISYVRINDEETVEDINESLEEIRESQDDTTQ